MDANVHPLLICRTMVGRVTAAPQATRFYARFRWYAIKGEAENEEGRFGRTLG